MAFLRSPYIKFTAIDTNGLPLIGGKVYTYIAGTNTPTDTWSDFGITLNSNPIILNSMGQANIFLTENLAYKYVIKDALDNTVDTQDNIIALMGSGGGSMTIQNIGTGEGIFAQTVGSIAQFKSLKQGNNVLLSSTADEITISANSTTAGLLNRVYFLGDETTVNSVDYYALSATDKGLLSVEQTVTCDDGQQFFFAQDFISDPYDASGVIKSGQYNAIFTAKVNSQNGEQSYEAEVYLCDNLGSPIASGVSGAPIGDLGVQIIGRLTSGIVDMQADTLTQIHLNANVASDVTYTIGQRIRFHCLAKKIGTNGSSVVLSLFSGLNYDSYVDVPVSITTDMIADSRNGAILTNSLNNLQPLDADLTAISALSGDGLLRKASGVWGMDTNAYITGSALSGYLPLTFASNKSLTYTGQSSFRFDGAGSFYAQSLANNRQFRLDPHQELITYFGAVQASLAFRFLTASRLWSLPDESGTIALTSQIPSVANYIAKDGTTTTTASIPFAQGLSVPQNEYADFGAFPIGDGGGVLEIGVNTGGISNLGVRCYHAFTSNSFIYATSSLFGQEVCLRDQLRFAGGPGTNFRVWNTNVGVTRVGHDGRNVIFFDEYDNGETTFYSYNGTTQTQIMSIKNHNVRFHQVPSATPYDGSWLGMDINGNLVKTSAPNPFNQSLNTSDSVTFAGITTGGNVTVGGVVITGGGLTHTGNATDDLISSKITGDTQNRFTIDTDGSFLWGSGSVAPTKMFYYNGTNPEFNTLLTATAGVTATNQVGFITNASGIDVRTYWQLSGTTKGQVQINDTAKVFRFSSTDNAYAVALAQGGADVFTITSALTTITSQTKITNTANISLGNYDTGALRASVGGLSVGLNAQIGGALTVVGQTTSAGYKVGAGTNTNFILDGGGVSAVSLYPTLAGANTFTNPQTITSSLASLTITPTTSAGGVYSLISLMPNLPNASGNTINLGKAQTANNSALLTYNHVADGSASNSLTIGLITAGNVVKFGADLSTLFYGAVTLPTGTATLAPLNIGAFGVTKTTPIDGDLWKSAVDTLVIRMSTNTRTIPFLERANTFTGAQTINNTLTTNNSISCRQLGGTNQTSATTTGAITFTLSSGSDLYLTGALTGAVTLNITAPLVGSESLVYFTQGATAQTLTLSMASVVFKQTNGSTGTGTGTYAVSGITNVNGNYCIRIFWATSTLAYVSIN